MKVIHIFIKLVGCQADFCSEISLVSQRGELQYFCHQRNVAPSYCTMLRSWELLIKI